MGGFIGEAIGAVTDKAVLLASTEVISNGEIRIGFVILFVSSLCGAIVGYKQIYKGKQFVWFVFIGHIFLSLVAALIAFLLCFIYGPFRLSGIREDIHVSFAKTAVILFVVALIGTDALSIVRKFMKDNLLSFLEKVLKAFERKA